MLPLYTNAEHVWLFMRIGRYLQKLLLPLLSSSTEEMCARKRGTSVVFKGHNGSGLLFDCTGGVLGWSTGDVVASPVSFPPYTAVGHKAQIPQGH
jgi:hypothetical protein